MLLRTYAKLSFLTAAGVLAVLLSGEAPASAGDTVNLGPVGPNQPILATFGGKRLIAYYEPDGDICAVSVVVSDASPAGDGRASSRIRVALHPGELFHLDAVGGEQVVLTCGPNAAMLTVLNRGEVLMRSASIN